MGGFVECGDSSPHGSESGDESPHSTTGGLSDDQGPKSRPKDLSYEYFEAIFHN